MTQQLTQTPEVVVVTPVYNGGADLEKTLASVQAQTYPNLIHVVLDNASSDQTAELIAGALNGRVPLITKRNTDVLNQIDNWNAAMAMVPDTAKYIKFLPADDLMMPECVERMVALAEQNSDLDFISALDVVNDHISPPHIDDAETIFSGRDFGAAILTGKFPWFSAAHMFFRNKPGLLDNPFSKVAPKHLDIEFVVRALLDRKAAFIPEPLLFSRYTENTVSANIGGGPFFLLPHYELLLAEGRRFLSRAEFEQEKRKRERKMLRHVIHWRLRGRQDAADQVMSRLKELEADVSLPAMLQAIAEWPFYKFKKTSEHKSRDMFHLSEITFLKACGYKVAAVTN